MFNKCKVFSVLLLGNVLSVSSFAQTVPFNDTIQKIDALFNNWNTHTPGGVLTIARKGEIIYNKAFGMADLERDVVVTTQTIFETGSVAKQFTAAAILLLVEQGKLSLEDDIRKYLPELPDYGSVIKIRHLMHHTSGLREWGALINLTRWGRFKYTYNNDEVLETLVRQKKLNYPPGDHYSYLNTGYFLLAIIVKRVSGMPFADFCKQYIFDPLGMKHTQWRDDLRRIVKNRAMAYAKNGDTYVQNMPFEMVHGGGGLLTTTTDLILWNQNYKTKRIGGKAFADFQLKPAVLNNALQVPYAAGLAIDNYNSFKEIIHLGYTAGYRGLLAYYPTQELSVAFLSNDAGADPSNIGAKVAALFLGERISNEPVLKTIIPTTISLQKKAGVYKSERWNDFLRLDVKDNHLQVFGQALAATEENTFYLGNEKLEFKGDQFVLYTENGDTVIYVKKESVEAKADNLQDFVGTYRSDEANVMINVSLKEGMLETLIQPDIRAGWTPYYKDAFQNVNGEVIEFQRDKNKKIVGFHFHTYGAWFIEFVHTK